MLLNLHVRNLALIEDIEVDFGPGLNILTGETGAGKSILLGSVQLILGARAKKEMIRQGKEWASVELLFQADNPQTAEALKALDIVPEDGQVVLGRKITDTRSICKINGETCTVAQMKAAAGCLLDIHGQHEHQSLLHEERQLEILDSYAGRKDQEAAEQVKNAYGDFRKIREELESLDMDETKRAREIAFLEFEIGEIGDAALSAGEDETLEKKFRKLENARKIAEVLQEVHQLSGSDEGAGDLLGNASRELSRITRYDDGLSELLEMLEGASALLDDFNRSLSSYMDGLVFDEEELYETEQRLTLINNLKLKYGGSIPAILEYRENQMKKLETLQKYEENLADTKRRFEKAEKRLKEKCAVLSDIRRNAAEKLEKAVRDGLKDLNFLDNRFEILFSSGKNCTANGWDQVSYEIATNPGEPLMPLKDVASGGELSRIMLVIKTLLASKDEMETLIFDEIDTGISGRTAQKVSDKMAEIGRHRQVIAITHLPQIAAMADRHFEIEKHVGDEGTVTQIHPLEREGIRKELARLLGGGDLNDAAMQNAEEMKREADSRKEKVRLSE